MYEHFMIDTQPKDAVADGKARDDDYDKEYNSNDSASPEQKSDGVPDIPAHEHWEDPDFDAEWNSPEDPVSDTDDVGENPFESGVEHVDLQEDIVPDSSNNYNSDEWEEV